MSGLRSPFGPGDWQRLSRETLHKGRFRLERDILRHTRYDGTPSADLKREIFVSGDAVTVLPWDPATDTVLLIEQFRAGPAAIDDHPWVIEVIAGRVDADESAADAGRREAEEEAALIITAMEEIGRFYPTPGAMAERLTHFVALCDLSGAGGTHGVDGEQEDIRTILCPFETALAAVASGEIKTGPAVISLQWLALNRSRLRAAGQ